MSRKCSIGAPAKLQNLSFYILTEIYHQRSKWLSPLVYKKWLWICFCQHVILWNAKSRSRFYKAKIFLNKKYTKKEKKHVSLSREGWWHHYAYKRLTECSEKPGNLVEIWGFCDKNAQQAFASRLQSQIANAFSLIMCWFF